MSKIRICGYIAKNGKIQPITEIVLSYTVTEAVKYITDKYGCFIFESSQFVG